MFTMPVEAVPKAGELVKTMDAVIAEKEKENERLETLAMTKPIDNPTPNTTRVWVDPPSGWHYGFPRIWDMTKEPKLSRFLVSEGYPEKEVEFALKWIRMWNA